MLTDTLLPDTLAYDSAAVRLWQADAGHDYNGQLQAPDPNFAEWFWHWFGRILEKAFGNEVAERYGKWIFVALCLLLVLLVLYFIFRYRPGLFVRTRRRQPKQEYRVTEDTIYGVDFVRDIAEALQRGNYREAIRLLYLETLKGLDDAGSIAWQPNKTPTEYVRELKPAEGKALFRRLTGHFLRVRYGNFEATQELFEEMRALQAEVRDACKREGGEA